jgi:hypothetical protein
MIAANRRGFTPEHVTGIFETAQGFHRVWTDFSCAWTGPESLLVDPQGGFESRSPLAHRAHIIATTLHRLLPPKIALADDYVAKVGSIGTPDSFGGALEVGMVGLNPHNWLLELTHTGLGCGRRTRRETVRVAAVGNSIVRATRVEGRKRQPLLPSDIAGICDVIR